MTICAEAGRRVLDARNWLKRVLEGSKITGSGARGSKIGPDACWCWKMSAVCLKTAEKQALGLTFIGPAAAADGGTASATVAIRLLVVG